jgi:hypothetical protein
MNKITVILFCTFLLITACVTEQAPEPVLTEEMKQVQVVYGWEATDILEKAGCEGVRMETIVFNEKKDPYAIQTRAVQLSADVAQVVYNDDVRFWICGKAKQKQEVAELPKIKLGELIGTIGGFDGAEIIVNGKEGIGRQAPMGRALIVDAKGEYVYLQSTFPMQTVVKCKITSGDRALIKKGMKVYLKP